LQKILTLAEKNGIAKSDISSGVLTVRSFYDAGFALRESCQLYFGTSSPQNLALC
jgi:hypothetical protein